MIQQRAGKRTLKAFLKKYNEQITVKYLNFFFNFNLFIVRFDMLKNYL